MDKDYNNEQTENLNQSTENDENESVCQDEETPEAIQDQGGRSLIIHKLNSDHLDLNRRYEQICSDNEDDSSYDDNDDDDDHGEESEENDQITEPEYQNKSLNSNISVTGNEKEVTAVTTFPQNSRSQTLGLYSGIHDIVAPSSLKYNKESDYKDKPEESEPGIDAHDISSHLKGTLSFGLPTKGSFSKFRCTVNLNKLNIKPSVAKKNRGGLYSSSGLLVYRPSSSKKSTKESKDVVKSDKVTEKVEKKKITDNIDHLCEELQIGYRILTELMSDSLKTYNTIFMETIELNKTVNGDYLKVVEKPVWLPKIKEKLLKEEYKDLTELVADIRLMLQNTYKYFGTAHSFSRKGLRMEFILEQKLALLSRDLKNKCTLEATHGVSPEEYKEINRTKSSRITVNGDNYFSYLLYSVRGCRLAREKEMKLRRMELMKRAKIHKEREMVEWEETLFDEPLGGPMRNMWEIPQITQFIFLGSQVLNISEISVYEMERILMIPEASMTLRMLMTSLVSSPQQRQKLAEKPFMPYSIWAQKLAHKTFLWYKVFYREKKDPDKLYDQLGIEPRFWEVCGKLNPFDQKLFHEMTLYQRIWLVKSLCDYSAHNHKSVQEAIAEQPEENQRECVLGRDSKGNEYLHFPQMCAGDVRVYRRKEVKFSGEVIAPEEELSQSSLFTKDQLRSFRKLMKRIRKKQDYDNDWDSSHKKQLPKKKKRKKDEPPFWVKPITPQIPERRSRPERLRQTPKARYSQENFIDSDYDYFMDEETSSISKKLRQSLFVRKDDERFSDNDDNVSGSDITNSVKNKGGHQREKGPVNLPDKDEEPSSLMENQEEANDGDCSMKTRGSNRKRKTRSSVTCKTCGKGFSSKSAMYGHTAMHVRKLKSLGNTEVTADENETADIDSVKLKKETNMEDEGTETKAAIKGENIKKEVKDEEGKTFLDDVRVKCGPASPVIKDECIKNNESISCSNGISSSGNDRSSENNRTESLLSESSKSLNAAGNTCTQNSGFEQTTGDTLQGNVSPCANHVGNIEKGTNGFVENKTDSETKTVYTGSQHTETGRHYVKDGLLCNGVMSDPAKLSWSESGLNGTASENSRFCDGHDASKESAGNNIPTSSTGDNCLKERVSLASCDSSSLNNGSGFENEHPKKSSPSDKNISLKCDTCAENRNDSMADNSSVADDKMETIEERANSADKMEISSDKKDDVLEEKHDKSSEKEEDQSNVPKDLSDYKEDSTDGKSDPSDEKHHPSVDKEDSSSNKEDDDKDATTDCCQVCPNAIEFELVAATVAELRNLISRFGSLPQKCAKEKCETVTEEEEEAVEDNEEDAIDEGDSNCDENESNEKITPEDMKHPKCEEKLHRALCKLLMELAPIESKMTVNFKQARKKLWLEYNDWKKREESYIDPAEEAWLSDPEPEPLPSATPTPKPSSSSSSSDESYNDDGTRKRKLRKRRAKKLGLSSSPSPASVVPPLVETPDEDSVTVSSRGRVRKVKKIFNYDNLDFDKLAQQAKKEETEEKERRKKKKEEDDEMNNKESLEEAAEKLQIPLTGVKRYILNRAKEVVAYVDEDGKIHATKTQRKEIRPAAKETNVAIKPKASNEGSLEQSLAVNESTPKLVVSAVNDEGKPVYVRVFGAQALHLMELIEQCRDEAPKQIKLQRFSQSYSFMTDTPVLSQNIPGYPDSDIYNIALLNNASQTAPASRLLPCSTPVTYSKPLATVNTSPVLRPSIISSAVSSSTVGSVPSVESKPVAAVTYQGALTSVIHSAPSVQSHVTSCATLSAATKLVTASPSVISAAPPITSHPSVRVPVVSQSSGSSGGQSFMILNTDKGQQQQKVAVSSERLSQIVQKGQRLLAVPNGKGGYTLTFVAMGDKNVLQQPSSSAGSVGNAIIAPKTIYSQLGSSLIKSPDRAQQSSTVLMHSQKLEKSQQILSPAYSGQSKVAHASLANTISRQVIIQNPIGSPASTVLQPQQQIYHIQQQAPQKVLQVVHSRGRQQLVQVMPAGQIIVPGNSIGSVSSLQQPGGIVMQQAKNTSVIQQPTQVLLQQSVQDTSKVIQVAQPEQLIQQQQVVIQAPQQQFFLQQPAQSLLTKDVASLGQVMTGISQAQNIQHLTQVNQLPQGQVQQEPDSTTELSHDGLHAQSLQQPTQQICLMPGIAQPQQQIRITQQIPQNQLHQIHLSEIPQSQFQQHGQIGQNQQLISQNVQQISHLQIGHQHQLPLPQQQITVQQQPHHILQATVSQQPKQQISVQSTQQPTRTAQQGRLVLVQTNEGQKVGIQMPDGRLSLLSTEQLQPLIANGMLKISS